MSSTTRAGSSTSPPSAAARQGLGAGLAGLRSRYPLAFFVGRRLVALIVLGIGITLVAFVLTQLVPGDPAEANLGQRAGSDPAAVRAFRAHYGLDKPLPVQYGLYLLHLTQGDLGQSQQSHRAVRSDLAEYIPATAELAISSMLVAGVLGVSLGVLAAVRRNRLTDHVLRVVSLGGISMPIFWLALVGLYLFFYKLSLVPGSGRLDPGVLPPPHVTGLYIVDGLLAGQPDVAWNALQHLVLPALVLAAYNIGLLTRFTRSAVLEVIDTDYVRAARAKGLPERRVVWSHVLHAALPPVVTVAGLGFANVMTGTVLVENIFAWPGIGQYAYRSATTLDLPAIMGVTLFVAVVYVLVNLCVDLLHGVIDPRIRVT